jgi:asparagine synthase (glutamine-hydrolysing)
MCGFAGLLTSERYRHDELRAITRRMADTLVHRGPDSSGEWVDAQAGIGLGFRRLAIIDLSELGHQPMMSASGRFWITFNGEVFNFAALREELEAAGARFRGHSDTEVILAGFERWGIEASVKRFIGMFAMAVWDTQTRSLTLIRDRLGIKPLFIYHHGGLISFGSELKALQAGPSFDRALDRQSLTQYLRYLYVEAPRSIFRHVSKLRPGHMLTLTDPTAPLPESRPFWTLEETWQHGQANRFRGSENEAVDALDELLSDSVRLRLQADVPLGALFSGGIDSSTVVALMQEQSQRPVKTFTCAFDAAEHNEAHHAARLAKHLGTDHTELMITGDDALSVVPKLADLFDEPQADTAQIPAYLVCALARREVTVALSGDGGDEVFGGYNRYAYGARLLPRIQRMPAPARRLVASGIGLFSSDSLARAHQRMTPVLPTAFRQRLAGEKLVKLGQMMGRDGDADMYRSLVSAWQEPHRLVIGGPEPASAVDRVLSRPWPSRLIDRMMYADQLGYLPDDQLAKIDRVSMGVSLEVRVPLLDHRIVEFASTLPTRFKVATGKGKLILRRVLYRRVPEELVERPKMGFSVPLAQWLRGPLRQWSEDLLSEDALRRDEILQVEPIRRSWKSFLEGRGDSALGLWSVLVFQAWRQRWLS